MIRKKQGLQNKIASMVEPSIETRKASLAENPARAYQNFSEIEEAKGGDPEPRARKVLYGIGLSI